MSQLRAIAKKLGISEAEAAKRLGIDEGFVLGGNYNFKIDESRYRSGVAQCNGSERCGNGLHYQEVRDKYYVHLDAASPTTFLGVLIHLGVDVLGGNVIWTVIPRR